MFGYNEHDVCEVDFDNYKELGAFLSGARSHGTVVKALESHGTLRIGA